VRSSARACSSEGDKFLNVDLVGAAGFRIDDVGEPFELGLDLGQIAELRRRQSALFNRNHVLHHAVPRPFF